MCAAIHSSRVNTAQRLYISPSLPLFIMYQSMELSLLGLSRNGHVQLHHHHHLRPSSYCTPIGHSAGLMVFALIIGESSKEEGFGGLNHVILEWLSFLLTLRTSFSHNKKWPEIPSRPQNWPHPRLYTAPSRPPLFSPLEACLCAPVCMKLR